MTWCRLGGPGINSCSQTLATRESQDIDCCTPTPRIRHSEVLGVGRQDFTFLASSQVMLPLGIAAAGTTLETTGLGHGQ